MQKSSSVSQTSLKKSKFSATTVELQLKGINIAFKVQILDKKMVIKNKLGALGKRNMFTQDFNKHRVTCKIFSLQARMRKDKRILMMKNDFSSSQPISGDKSIVKPHFLMNFSNIISIVFNNKKTKILIIIIFKKIILKFKWMVFSQLAIFQDSNFIPFNIHKLKQILWILFNNNKIDTFIANRLINRNINLIMTEKTDIQAETKFQKNIISSKKMKVNHLELLWSLQKENR